jgi:multiple sugar transport system ATP-binding protein
MADVVLRDIRKSFGDIEVIHGASLTIEDGEFVVFVGPSGCGKSTLLRLIAGLEEITAGEIMIGGKRCNDLPPSERGVAMVFQSYALYPHMSVYENMAFALKLARVDSKEIAERVERAAEILQIKEYLGRKPKALSGGQRQRVAIGRAIVREPQVFLFDEPLSNLDAALRVQMRIEISKLHDDLETTIVYVTHDQVEAMTMADRIVVLNQGNVEQFGAPLELYLHPKNRFVAGFIGSPKMNFFAGALRAAEDGVARVILPGDIEIRAAVDATRADKDAGLILGIRPEHVIVGQAEGASIIPGEVALVEHLGEQTLLYIKTRASDALLVVRQNGISRVKTGENIQVSVLPGSCYLFEGEGEGEGAAFPRLDVDVGVDAGAEKTS